VRRAVETLRPGLESSYATLERGAAFLGDPSRTVQVDLTGGLRLVREGARVYVAASRSDLPAVQWPQMPTDANAVQITSVVDVALSSGWHFSAETWPSAAEARDQAEQNGDPLQVWLDAETLPESLELRVLRPGDRFEPLGMAGHSQKLSDFFVNAKLPQRARRRWPLLCSGATVIWVPGYRPAHPFRLTPASQKVLHFAVSPPETDSV
jgi:tRNA(Ile)-lysidine synthase